VVPADHKWFRNLAVAHTIAEAMKQYKGDWEREIERRGRAQLAAIAALKSVKK
jgi:phosphohistidine phosphatase SixA